jgi:hypothetical protein
MNSKIVLFPTLLILLLCNSEVFCQNLQAFIQDVFIVDEDKGIYSGRLQMQSGTVKLGEVLRPVDLKGNVFEFKVTEMYDPSTYEALKNASGKRDVSVTIQTVTQKKLEKPFSGSLTFGSASGTTSEISKKDIVSTCSIDGKSWNGMSYHNSCLYYPKGNSLIKSTQPTFVLGLRSANTPDDRELTIKYIGPLPKVGKVDSKHFEIMFSGSADGIKENTCMVSNWKNGQANTQKMAFHFEITQWEDKGNHIILSAKYSGKLYGLNMLKGLIGEMCKNIEVASGEIKSLRIAKL